MLIHERKNNFWDELALLSDEPNVGFYLDGWREFFAYLVDMNVFMELLNECAEKIPRHILCRFWDGCSHCTHMKVRSCRDGTQLRGTCYLNKIPHVTLRIEDVRLMRFNYDMLHRRISEVLPVIPNMQPASAPLTWLLGNLHFGTGNRRRVYISYLMPGDMLKGVGHLLATENKPCFVLSPHCDKIKDELRVTLNALQVTFIPIQDVLEVDQYCRVHLRQPLHPVLKAYADSETAVSLNAKTFSVPGGTQWSDIHIHFLDGHTVNCRLGRSHVTFSYQDMGMMNAHTGQPDSNWNLLAYFAGNDGVWKSDWKTFRGSKSAQQRKRRLCLALQKFFGLATEPIHWDYERNAYICAFDILPESHSSNYHRRLRPK